VAKGIVYLVGAGPGDPRLITQRGAECIARAEVIVYDRLVAPELLALAKPQAERIYVGKEASRHALEQDQINALLAERGQSQVVCRLKGGDPFVFGRGGEEARYLRERGVPFEVVPGVTSAIAAPAYAGIAVTDRTLASTVAFVTGREDAEKTESTIPWDSLAGMDTLVILMGVGALPEIAAQLLAHGRAAGTPAAVIERGTTPAQRTVVGTLGDIAEKVRQAGLKPPAVTVVGEVVRLREAMRWFDAGPLFGKRIVVTRSREQASALSHLLRERGAEPIEVPVIRIAPIPAEPEAVRALMSKPFDWVIFTSANGVRLFVEQLHGAGLDVRALGPARLAAIGPATAGALRAFGLAVDLVPGKFVAEELAAALPADLNGRRVLLPGARERRDVVARTLRERGAEVVDWPVYEALPGEAQALADGRIDLSAEALGSVAGAVSGLLAKADAITFASSSAVRHFVRLAGAEARGAKVACIGPVTAEAARRLGLPVDVVAEEYTIPGLVRALENAFASEAPPPGMGEG
jgi:uroporphyrinogen III methyltransferase/synthase